MEDRDDLERLLLDGLPDDERELTRETIANANAAKLKTLRARRDSPFTVLEQPSDQDDPELVEEV